MTKNGKRRRKGRREKSKGGKKRNRGKWKKEKKSTPFPQAKIMATAQPNFKVVVPRHSYLLILFKLR